MQKLRSEIAEYLDRIDPENITPDIWGRTVHWIRWHGDGKSSTRGVFHIESMLTTEMDYNVKLHGGSGSLVLLRFAWTQAERSSPPSIQEVLDALKMELAEA